MGKKKDIFKSLTPVLENCKRHGDFGKLEGLERDDTIWGFLIERYPWKDKENGEEKETRAVFFRVKNGRGTRHNVILARHPETGDLHIWCGDTFCHNHLGMEEDPCWFWRNFAKGEPHCKHVAYVLQYLQDNPEARRRIVEQLYPETGKKSPIATALKLSKSLLIYGPTGSGKTYEVMEMVKKERLPLYQINITNGLEDIDLLQKLLPNPETKGWRRVEGELVKAFKHAKEEKIVILLEEVSRSSKSLRNLLIKTMDKKDNSYTLHDFTSGEYITVPAENIVWIGTANLGGSYGDTSELDPALMRRFSLTHFKDYNPAQEIEILKKMVDEEMAKKMVEFAKKVRENYLAGRLPYPLDTGSLVEWAEVTKEIEDPIGAAELTFLYRIVERDSFGYPESGQLEVLKEELEALF